MTDHLDAVVYHDHGYWVGALAWSPDGKRIAAGLYVGPVSLLDAQTGAVNLEMQGEWIGARSVA